MQSATVNFGTEVILNSQREETSWAKGHEISPKGHYVTYCERYEKAQSLRIKAFASERLGAAMWQDGLAEVSRVLQQPLCFVVDSSP